MPRSLSLEPQVLEVGASQNRSINCAQNMRIERFRWFRSTCGVVSGTPNCFSIIFFKSEPIWSKAYVDFLHLDTFQAQIVTRRFRIVSTVVRWFSDFISVEFITTPCTKRCSTKQSALIFDSVEVRSSYLNQVNFSQMPLLKFHGFKKCCLSFEKSRSEINSI